MFSVSQNFILKNNNKKFKFIINLFLKNAAQVHDFLTGHI